jgi:uncharacterized protein YukE
MNFLSEKQYESLVYGVFYLNVFTLMTFLGLRTYKAVSRQCRRLTDAYDRLDSQLSQLNRTMTDVSDNLNQLNQTGQEVKKVADDALNYQVMRDTISAMRFCYEKFNVRNFFPDFSPFLKMLPIKVQYEVPTQKEKECFTKVKNEVHTQTEESSGELTPPATPQSGKPGSPRTLNDLRQLAKVTEKSSDKTLNDLKKLAEVTEKLLNETAAKHGVETTPVPSEKAPLSPVKGEN